MSVILDWFSKNYPGQYSKPYPTSELVINTIVGLRIEVEKLEAENAALKQRYAELDESFEAMNKDGIGLTNDIFKLQDALDKSESENAALRAALEAANAEINILHLAMYQREDVSIVISSDEYKEFMNWAEDNRYEKL